MTPEQAVVERLNAIGSVTAIVAGRIYMLKLPQKSVLPAIRVQHISQGAEYHQRGESGLKRARVQVDAYAAEASGGLQYANAIALADAIHGDGNGASASGLSGWIGTVGGSPATMQIVGVFLVDRVVGYEAEELREVRVRQDYMVHWNQG